MPVFEFRCQNCGSKFSVLIGMTAEQSEDACPQCGSKRTEKLVSRFARFRNEDGRIDEMADQLEALGEPESPSQMRQIMREMGKAMDDDMGDEMEELFESDMAGDLEDEL